METYNIGKIIRETRTRRNISQEELSDGICSPVTLSRIENGMQKPSLKIEEALLERLGYHAENLVVYADEREVRKHRLESEIQVRIMHYEKTEDLIEEYVSLLATRGAEMMLEKQFVQMAVAVQGLYTGEWNLEKVKEEIVAAIRLTMPDFSDVSCLYGKIYTNTEIQLLNNLGIVFVKQNKMMKASQLFLALVEFVEKNEMDVEIKNRTYPMLVHNLVRTLEETGSMDEMLVYAEKGIAYCVQNNRLNCLPDLLYYSGLGYQKTGRIDEAVYRYRQAVSFLEVTGRMESAAYLQKEIEQLIVT